MVSVLPYLAYLTALYFLAARLKLGPALLGATMVWFVAAALLVVVWYKLRVA